MLTNILQFFSDIASGTMAGLGALLESPFRRITQMSINNQILSFLNWVFPISEAVALLQLWCGCIAAYYIFMFFKNSKALKGLKNLVN